MKFTLIVTFLCLGMINAQVTQLEVLKAWNFYRANPVKMAALIQKTYLDKNIKGVPKDENCYVSAVEALKAASAAPLMMEMVGLDLAAWTHSKDLLEKVGKLSHIGSDKSTIKTRIERFGKFYGKYQFYEMITYDRNSKFISADSIVMSLVADCGLASKKQREIFFKPELKQFGVGVAYANKKTYVTLLAAVNFFNSPVKNSVLDEAKIEGKANFNGEGAPQPIAEARGLEYFLHSGSQIYVDSPSVGLINPHFHNGPLGDLKDDGSITCTDWINKDLLIATIHQWSRTATACKQGSGAFFRPTNLDRTKPFAKDKKCYHRLRFCDAEGKVWVKDRQFKTLQETKGKTLVYPEQIIKSVVSDNSIKCPHWVNTDLRKRIVQDWYRVKGDCVRGKDGYAANGIKRITPFSVNRDCYHRYDYCSEKGNIWMQDSEYLTLPEWEARRVK